MVSGPATAGSENWGAGSPGPTGWIGIVLLMTWFLATGSHATVALSMHGAVAEFQGRRAAQEQAEVGRWRVVGEADVVHRPQQAAHRDLDLELREHRADAEMPPGAECEVVGGGAERAVAVEVSAVHVEPVGLREAALVAVGRAEEAQHLGVGRDLTAADLNGAAGATRDHVRRRGVAHRLGEGAAHQLGPLAQLGELLGVGDEVAREGGERLLYRFAAGEDHQHAEADDLVVAELLAVDLAVG